jgi:hypothetical protein
VISRVFAILLACACGIAGTARVAVTAARPGADADLGQTSAPLPSIRDAGLGRLALARHPAPTHAANAALPPVAPDLPPRLLRLFAFSTARSRRLESASTAARSSRGPPASTTRS